MRICFCTRSTAACTSVTSDTDTSSWLGSSALVDAVGLCVQYSMPVSCLRIMNSRGSAVTRPAVHTRRHCSSLAGYAQTRRLQTTRLAVHKHCCLEHRLYRTASEALHVSMRAAAAPESCIARVWLLPSHLSSIQVTRTLQSTLHSTCPCL